MPAPPAALQSAGPLQSAGHSLTHPPTNLPGPPPAGNFFLEVKQPLTALNAFTRLRCAGPPPPARLHASTAAPAWCPAPSLPCTWPQCVARPPARPAPRRRQVAGPARGPHGGADRPLLVARQVRHDGAPGRRGARPAPPQPPRPRAGGHQLACRASAACPGLRTLACVGMAGPPYRLGWVPAAHWPPSPPFVYSSLCIIHATNCLPSIRMPAMHFPPCVCSFAPSPMPAPHYRGGLPPLIRPLATPIARHKTVSCPALPLHVCEHSKESHS